MGSESLISPYVSAPSSPTKKSHRPCPSMYYSAPSSPVRASCSSITIVDWQLAKSRRASVPFDWEETPGTPKNRSNDPETQEEDFEFDFNLSSRFSTVVSVTSDAEELFSNGQIKPLTPSVTTLPPPPCHHGGNGNGNVSNPCSPRLRRKMTDIFKLKTNDQVFDPFLAALEETRKDSSDDEHRGRHRSRSHRRSRSFSPFRVFHWDAVDDNNAKDDENDRLQDGSEDSSKQSTEEDDGRKKNSSRKRWRLADLFRNASDVGKDKVWIVSRHNSGDGDENDKGAKVLSSMMGYEKFRGREKKLDVDISSSKDGFVSTHKHLQRFGVGIFGCLGMPSSASRRRLVGVNAKA